MYCNAFLLAAWHGGCLLNLLVYPQLQVSKIYEEAIEFFGV
jgi:hypothetical protein